jgi:hypothetical protein
MIITTALSNVFGCQHPASGVPAPENRVLSAIGGSAHVDFSSRTSRVSRKPLVKKYRPAACIHLYPTH